MAKLTTDQRNNLPSSSFAEPGKRAFPINDPSHARAALSRVSQFGSPAEKAKVRSKVHKKFPGMGAGIGKRVTGKKMPMEEKMEGKKHDAREDRMERK